MTNDKLTFKEFLSDGIPIDVRNVHLEHIEDEILNFSYSGARDALSFVEAVAGTLVGHDTNVNVTAKWDGSPAIFVGTNPENGKFFIATKSIFNKQPKVSYTPEDINEHYSGELATKLNVALHELCELGIEGILQGDLMFIQNDLRHQVINEIEYVTFTPNTITYAVPAKSFLGETITASNIGVIFHTSYEGETLSELSASFTVDLQRLQPSNTVWYDDATHLDESVSITFNHHELYLLQRHLELAELMFADLEESDLDAMVDHPSMVKMIKMYTNKSIMDDSISGDSSKMVNGLIDYIHERLESEKDSLKTEEARERRDDKKKELHAFIESERRMLETVFEFQKHIVFAKKVLLRKLGEVSRIDTFLETSEGYVPTTPEGFVVVNHQSNRAVKLVDRLEFSRANFHRNRK